MKEAIKVFGKITLDHIVDSLNPSVVYKKSIMTDENLLPDPEFLLKLGDGRIDRSECTRCNQCVVEMDREGVRCVIPTQKLTSVQDPLNCGE